MLVVCWHTGSAKLIYSQAAANTRVVGATGAKLLGQAHKLGQDLNKVHCIGHSLGSHTCGYLGNGVQADLDASIGRITGERGPRGETVGPAQPNAIHRGLNSEKSLSNLCKQKYWRYSLIQKVLAKRRQTLRKALDKR